MKKQILFGFFCLICFHLPAQQTTGYKVEMFGSVASGQNTPFWTVQHRWGVVPVEAGNGYLRGGVFRQQKINSDWSFDAGLNLTGSTSDIYGNSYIQQLYAGLKWKTWKLSVGSQEEYTSLLNAELSSGDFVQSNHARPVPKIKLALHDFYTVPYTRGILSIKGDFSVGYYLDGQWQEDRALPAKQPYTKNILSHDKSLSFRFGNIEKNRQQFIMQVQHAAQWGGVLYYYQNAEYTVQHQPQGLDDLFRVAVAKEGSASASGADRAYVAGSNWGAYVFKYDYRLKNNDRLSVYIDHFFEDGSGMVFKNYPDNLYGLEFSTTRRSLVSGIVLEYIYTKQQGGAVGNTLGLTGKNATELFQKGNGNDNYYNNVDYVTGPSYFGYTMGTPLFLPPVYNTDGSLNFKGIRISTFHFGLEGYVCPVLQYRLLLTAGKNWGRYYVPFRSVKKGFASQLELIYNCPKIDGFSIRLSGGYDKGEFFGGDTFGGSITLNKRGVILSR
ncbi:hypothetical protein AGMMS50262_19190 [Bacteroidia bacterium]|nr:hypothetical protein AGMMS50262_19190 [Bacteroidia bacterium]